jgi:hypothetical protein
MNRRVEQIVEANRLRMERLAGKMAASASARPQATTSSKPSSSGRRWRFSEPPAEEWAPAEGYFQPGGAAMWQITHFIFNAPHVQSNPSYRMTVRDTSFHLDERNPEVNAFASLERGENRPVIVLQGGCMAFSRLCGLAAAESPAALAELCGALGQILGRQRGLLRPSDAWQEAEELGLVGLLDDPQQERRAHSLASGMVAGIVAHELGHVVYGHVHREENVSEEVSRNMERDADSFAASVINSSPWGEYPVAGMVTWNVAQAWSEHLAGDPAATTHPRSAERALDLVRANESQAGVAGLDEATVRKALPPRAGGMTGGGR